jgi:ureidoacrylate peracid hydrolase
VQPACHAIGRETRTISDVSMTIGAVARRAPRVLARKDAAAPNKWSAPPGANRNQARRQALHHRHKNCCIAADPQERAMHELSIPADLVDRVTTRTGRPHPFDVIEPAKTAFVVVDMQNYFMKPGFQGEVPKARAIVPAVNRLAAAVRELGGHVVWVKNATNDTRESWSVFHDWLHTPQRRDRRYTTMDIDHEGHALWAELDAKPEDAQIVKKRFSAFLPGSSDIVAYLRGRGIDTVLIGGTATNVCCESSARDAMMLNFKVVMVHDVLATYTDEEHNATLRNFYSIFGDVQTLDEAIASLKRGLEKAAA